MEKLLYSMIIIFLSATACNEHPQLRFPLANEKNSSKVNSLNPDDHSLTVIIKDIVKSKWFDYYDIKVKDFKIDKFRFKNDRKELKLMQGSIIGDYDKSFNTLHEAFLINSPDGSKYIDLDYYQYPFEKNNRGEIICSGGEPDQEVNLVNRKTKEINRLCFNGTISQVEDALWLGNNAVVLMGYEENKLFLEFIDLDKLHFDHYLYTDTLTFQSTYSEKVRLKKVKFK
jgi:hypothetical protein